MGKAEPFHIRNADTDMALIWSREGNTYIKVFPNLKEAEDGVPLEVKVFHIVSIDQARKHAVML